MKNETTSPKNRKEKHRECTEQVAYKLYQNRLLLGRTGDERSDWEKAEKIIQNRLRSALFTINRPFIKLEKYILEPLLAWANNQALLSLLGLLGNVGIIVAAFTYIGLEEQRREAQVYLAWQTITNAHGQPGNGGRIIALEFLNASPGANWRLRFPWICVSEKWLCFKWEAENLAGVDVSNAFLVEIQLPGADLRRANLQKATLVWANLERANLSRANLEQTTLVVADLEQVNLYRANLQGADLGEANLQGARLSEAILKKAYLGRASLQGADLEEANLQGARLIGTNLQKANLEEANLQGARLIGTNLQGARLIGTNLQKALYANEQTPGELCEGLDAPCPTLFPKGFDPKTAGMTLIQ